MLEKVLVSIQTAEDLSGVVANPEWQVLSISEGRPEPFNIPGNHVSEQSFNLNWNVARFTLQLKRASSFYTNLFVWPLVLVLFIAMGIFILPPSCVERVSLGVLLMLSLVIISLMLESYTPKAAGMSVIGHLIGFNMFMVSWATVIATLIISIDKENFLMVKKIPPTLKNVFSIIFQKNIFFKF